MQQLNSLPEPNPNPGGARKSDPDTSYEAAQSVDATELERIVYNVIKSFPKGCTSDEIMGVLPHYGVQTISPRYAPLLRKGFIVDTGERRKARSGRSQRVMKVPTKDEQ
jgi:hypothetical protein